jgi:DNA-binding transcriptional MerR regulator
VKKIAEADNLSIKEFAEIVDLTPQAILYWVRQGES